MGARRYEASRLGQVPFSGIRRIMEEANRLEQAGASIIHLEIGRPDFDTPAHIKEAAKAALDRGDVHYTSNLGTIALRRAVSRKLRDENGLDYDPETEIMITVGAVEGIFAAAAAFLNPGEEMLVPDPGWVNYVSVPRIISAQSTSYRLREEAGFQPEAAQIAAAITPRTKLLVLLSPGNPTGTVASQDALREIAFLAQRHDLLVVADEIYERIVYDGAQHVSIASLPGMRDRTIVVNGFSKAYSMTGWRLGYLAASKELMPPLLKVHQNLVTCATSFAQAGGVAALEGPQECVAAMVQEFKRRRDMLIEALRHIPGVRCIVPQGAFYVFPNVSAFGLTSEAIAMYILQEAGVAVVPGTAFGRGGEGYIRISFANSFEQIEEATRRLAAALGRLATRT